MRPDHGYAVVAGRRSPLSHYDDDPATYDEGDAFDDASAVGFIESSAAAAGRGGAARRGRPAPRRGLDMDRPLLERLPVSVADPEGAPAG